MSENTAPEKPAAEQTERRVVDYVKDISDFAKSEISWVRSAYKWAISIGVPIVGIVVAAGIWFTYQSSSDFKKETREDIDRWKQRIHESMEAQLTKDVAEMDKRVESRIDDEFKKENIEKLVLDKAKARIDEIADPLIEKQIAAKVTPQITAVQDQLKQIAAVSVGEARRLSDELKVKNDSAIARLEKLDKSLSELKSLMDFTVLVTSAQADDRNAYDKLEQQATDASFPFRELALRTYEAINYQHSLPVIYSPAPPPSPPSPSADELSKMSTEELKEAYTHQADYFKRNMIEYICSRTNVTQTAKMDFLVDVLKRDRSLRAVEFAGRKFSSIAKFGETNPMATSFYIKWWEEHRDTFKEPSPAQH